MAPSAKYGSRTLNVLYVLGTCSITSAALIAPFVVEFYVDNIPGWFSLLVYAEFGMYFTVALVHITYMKCCGQWAWAPVWFYAAFGLLFGTSYNWALSVYASSVIVGLLWFYSVAYMIWKKYSWKLAWRYAVLGLFWAGVVGPLMSWFPYYAYLFITTGWVSLLLAQVYKKSKQCWKGRNIPVKQKISDFWIIRFPEPDAITLFDTNLSLREKYRFTLTHMWGNQFYRPPRRVPLATPRDEFTDFMSCKILWKDILIKHSSCQFPPSMFRIRFSILIR